MRPDVLLWTLVGFAVGAIPFAVLLARWFAGVDIVAASATQFGDGNPGGVNAWRAGGWRIGAPAIALEFLKGAIPVGAARYVGGVDGWALAPVALAPIVGHAFTPFLRGRGGKALAVTFGVWCGLTLYEAPLVLGLGMTIFYLLFTPDAWAAMLAMLGLGAYLLIRDAGAVLFVIWLGNLVILVWKHRRALREPLRLAPRLMKLLGQAR